MDGYLVRRVWTDIQYRLRRERKMWNRHPLLEAAIGFMKIPRDMAFEVTIFSDAPIGRAMIKAMEAASPSFRSIPIYLSPQGLRVWKHL
jgi:hypothetical protein